MQKADGHFAWTENSTAALSRRSIRSGLLAASPSRPPPRPGSTASARRPAGALGGRRADSAYDTGDRPWPGRRRRAHVPGRCRCGLRPRGGARRRRSQFGAGRLRCRVRARRFPVRSLNGVAETPEYGWSSRVDGVPGNGAVGLGDLVFLNFEATVASPGPAPAVKVPPLRPTEMHTARGPGSRSTARRGWRRRGRPRTDLPAGRRGYGCRGTVIVQFREHGDGRLSDGGSAPFEVGSGEWAR